MVLSKRLSPPYRRLTLTARFSGLLVLAVVLPLIITVVASEYSLRPTLIAQASDQMGTDASSHAQAIDALLIARLQDLQYLSQYKAIKRFLAGDPTYRDQAFNEMAVGNHLDPHYGNWTLFDATGNLVLSYPGALDRGQDKIPMPMLARLQNHNDSLISDVHLDTRTQMAYVDMYTLIMSEQNNLVGFGRATFLLNDIWTAVNNENSAAPGSYAMILDGNGVRIAYTNPDKTLTTFPAPLFKPVTSLLPVVQQQVKDENLYGNSLNAVQTLADPSLASMLQDHNWPDAFNFTPATKAENYQAYQVKTHVVPWTYIVLRPMNTITSAADRQTATSIFIAAIVMVIAAVVGMLVGRTVTRPILSSVNSLVSSSEMLNTLASREQVTATEQKWIVESSQTALQSVQYYTEATSVAARKLDEIGEDLKRNWNRSDPRLAAQRLNEILGAAQYIEKVSAHQDKSNQSLGTAIRIATQVTDQLIAGATSASEASSQLQEVIRQLRQVVGGNE
ncbi:hypothetical protein KDH_70670 [Dictyobacter sp. S3.2.2.5]|uniref:Cache domain-containing protein n=1 Tax=Dictyobacter halimunensis TaxID=3026934 RepID=A0ABQ6G162_9CHLR|nr:hypothetical protein KDH_70670 [Dictyobacter sp. S3.2.2.5]